MQYQFTRTESHDASVHAANLEAWEQSYLQATSGAFHGCFDHLQLGAIQVFRETANCTVLQSGHVSPDRLAMGLVVQAGQGARYCGHALQVGSVIYAPPGGDFQLLSGADMVLLGVSVPVAAVRMGGDGAAMRLPVQPCHWVGDTVPHLQWLLRYALQAAAKGELCENEPAQQQLSRALVQEVQRCCAALAMASERVACANKRRIVTQAHRYMQQHADASLAIPDLCKSIGTSRRALQYAFEEVLQINPVSYLRMLRLNQVRHHLLSHGASSVGDVAARWGFWHPSRFAADYRQLFGELPSATLQRSRVRAAPGGLSARRGFAPVQQAAG